MPRNEEKKREWGKEYYAKHKKEIRRKQKEYYEKNKEQRRKYLEAHPEYREQNNARSRKWYEKNKKKCKKYRQAKRMKFPWLSHYHSAKQRCNNPKDKNYKYYGDKGIQMLLTEEHVMILWLRDDAINLDRIDSNGDYDFGNCQFIEVGENSRRRNAQRRFVQKRSDHD